MGSSKLEAEALDFPLPLRYEPRLNLKQRAEALRRAPPWRHGRSEHQ